MADQKRLWKGIPLTIRTDVTTAETVVYLGNVVVAKSPPFEGDSHANWTVNSSFGANGTIFKNRYNGINNETLSQSEFDKLFFQELKPILNNDRGAVLNNNDNYDSVEIAENSRKTFAQTLGVPKVTDPITKETVSDDGSALVPRRPTSPGDSNNNGVNPKDTTLTKDIFDLTIEPNEVRSLFGPYKYPTDLGTNEQDFIQFTIKKYKARTFNLEGAIGILEQRQELTPIGTISLPIQPSISDSNNVDWNGTRLNPLEMELVSGSLNIMSGQGQQYVNDLIKRLETTIKDPNTMKAIKLYFAQKAAGTQGLLSRLGGGIVNPNLELLFQGPTLRPFTFTFRLSPREENEAREVRSIIRAFKEAMSVKTASQSFFLATPNIFDIKYVMRGQTDHPSLNKIKTCALKSCNVDYTPDGSYMTFNDTNATMTSYNLTLQFQELEPVTNQDYKDIPTDQIGY